MNDVRDRLGVHATQLAMARDFHVLQKLPNLRMGEALAKELFVRYLAIDQRDSGDVRQTVISCFTRLWFPFLRLAADDIDGSVVTFDCHRFYLCGITNFFSQGERSFNRA